MIVAAQHDADAQQALARPVAEVADVPADATVHLVLVEVEAVVDHTVAVVVETVA
ncbi:MAG: hypothetical protein KKD08_07660 [Alphaproteobacteria bacterium]|nr:hypothetical protein [Alphaproteobacteria bacterium]